jgi:hypothetical protein
MAVGRGQPDRQIAAQSARLRSASAQSNCVAFVADDVVVCPPPEGLANFTIDCVVWVSAHNGARPLKHNCARTYAPFQGVEISEVCRRCEQAGDGH